MNIAIRSGMLTAALLLITIPAVAQVADLVLRNGVIWTVDDDNPRAEAIASERRRNRKRARHGLHSRARYLGEADSH